MTEYQIVSEIETLDSKEVYYRLKAKLQGEPEIVVDEQTGDVCVYAIE